MGRNLEHCLELASSELNISIDKLNYKVISNKTSLFKKTFEIVAYVESELFHETYDGIEKTSIEESKNLNQDEPLQCNPNWGTAKVENGNLIISDGKNVGQGATIIKGSGITLIVDGKEIAHKAKVTSESKVEIIFETHKAKREVNIRISEDKLSAFIKVSYAPNITYNIEDVKEEKSIVLNAVKIKEDYPPQLTKDELILILKEKGISYGLIDEALEKALKDTDGSEILIAKGIPVEVPQDDILNIYFKQQEKKDFEIDDNGNVDFKSIGNVTSVVKGAILCVRIQGKEGLPGRNVFGQVIEAKKRKIKDLVPKEGCEFKDKNTIVATINGRPQMKGSSVSVHNVHEVFSDVDIKTGNIHFIGDVIIHGDVKEGMEIESGNIIYINSNIYRSTLKAHGDVEIKGNVISSSIVGGCSYVEVIKYVNILNTLANTFKSLYDAVEIIKHNTTIVKGISDRDIIRTVIANKYRNFRDDLNIAFKYMSNFKDNDDKVFRILQNKFSDIYFTNLQNFQELKYIENFIREKQHSISEREAEKSNATFNYVQDSNIECSGNIFITGKGIYKSFVTAMDSIYFVGDENSVARGGILKAINQVRAKVVGSPAGVSTVIAVAKEGHIYCDVAHHNTKLIVGEREIILENSYKDIHCYLNEDSELVLDKLKL